MNPQFQYSPSDMVSPQYCHRCKQHTPSAILEHCGGLCPDCQAAKGQSGEQPMVANEGAGQGFCPHCHSTSVATVPIYARNKTQGSLITVGVLTCILSVFCFWPLLLVGIPLIIVGGCLPAQRAIGTERRCNHCGQNWKSPLCASPSRVGRKRN
jgi:hypothetical protein